MPNPSPVCLARPRPSDADLFAFDNSVFNFDVNIRERGPKAVVEGIKALCTTCVNTAVVDYCARRKHLGNRFTPSLVPDFLKPTPAQVALEFGHQGSPSRFSLLQNRVDSGGSPRPRFSIPLLIRATLNQRFEAAD